MKKTVETLKINNNIIEHMAKQINEASNVLKYSFYLPQVVRNITKEKDFSFIVDKDKNIDLMEDINNAIYENLNSFIGNTKYDIFGYRGKYEKYDFSCLVYCDDFWRHVFKQHAILSTYDKLRRIIGQSVHLSNYNFYKYSNYTNNSKDTNIAGNVLNDCHHGLDYLLGLDNNDSCKPNFDIFDIKIQSEISSTSLSDYSANFTRQINSLNKKLDSINLLNQIKQSSNVASLDLLEFYQFSVSHKKKEPDNSFEMLDILNIHKKKTINCNDYCQYITSVGKMFNILKTNKAGHKLSLSDRVYLAYKIEKLLAPVTIDCLYQNILNIEEENILKNNYNDMINFSLMLPNVFTRQYILQIAVDTIGKHFDGNFTDKYFFTDITKNLESEMDALQNKNFISNQQKFSLLVNRYKKFIDYMALIVFPVYENYFFCTLWNSISKFCDNSTSTFISLYKKLSMYFNNTQNVEKIFNTEKIIMNYGINHNNIIKTHFVNYKSPCDKYKVCSKCIEKYKDNVKLYCQCIKSLKETIKNNNIPDFINLDYISGNYFSQKSEQKKREPKFRKYARVDIIKDIIDN